jgi:hypothetical protein
MENVDKSAMDVIMKTLELGNASIESLRKIVNCMSADMIVMQQEINELKKTKKDKPLRFGR